ncbi:TetR/AcrR family transcriptional regulator [Streptomyces sp. NPDC088350]|uniref:TetR/AcrR family transcriptional regulator n=1 Tax=Streptomyces sp. NPDC088350 TaxID=3365854 RepID=UPI003825F47B
MAEGSGADVPTEGGRPRRRDAALNREKVLRAAREVSGRHGLGVTLDDVARHTGVGVGTVYRRFPDKETLVRALFEQDLGMRHAACGRRPRRGRSLIFRHPRRRADAQSRQPVHPGQAARYPAPLFGRPPRWSRTAPLRRRLMAGRQQGAGGFSRVPSVRRSRASCLVGSGACRCVRSGRAGEG